MNHAKPVIEGRMAEYEEGQIEFAILSLVRDPLLDLLPTLAENLKISQEISTRLNNLRPDWKNFVSAAANGESLPQEATLVEPDRGYGLTPDAIGKAIVPEGVQQRLNKESVGDLVAFRQELMTAQAGIRTSIKEEQQSGRSDDEWAASRRHDYGPVVQAWVGMLAQKRMIEPLMEAVIAD